MEQTFADLCREHHRVKHQLHWHSDMQPDGTFKRAKKGRGKARCAQVVLMRALAK